MNKHGILSEGWTSLKLEYVARKASRDKMLIHQLTYRRLDQKEKLEHFLERMERIFRELERLEITRLPDFVFSLFISALPHQ